MKRNVLIIGDRRFLRITKKRAMELLNISKVFENKIFFNKEDNKYYIETANIERR